MKDNKLDKFFREKSEENLPKFDPKFWEQAERMLDDALPEEEDRKRGAWWWWLPLLLIGGCGVCWFGPFGKDNKWRSTDEKAVISETKVENTEDEISQIDFENKTENTNTKSDNTNNNTNDETSKTINSTKNNSNSLKNAIANIGQNDAPIRGSKEFLNEKNSTTSPASDSNKEWSSIPTETPETLSTDVDKTSDLTAITPIIEEDANRGKDLPKVEFLPTLNARYLENPLVEIEDSLTFDATQVQNLLNPKKLHFGWSIGAVVQREPFVDTLAKTVASLQAGMTLDYKLNKKWDLHFDVLGRRETNELVVKVGEADSISGKAYGFGVTEINNLYRFKTQYFVEGVGLLRYKLNERHALGIGIGAKYLFSVRADILQRSREVEFNFENYEVNFVNRDEVIESGWWEKEFTKDLLPFVQLRYDYRTTRNTTLFFKMNGEYNRTWYPGADDIINFNERRFRLETSFGFNYQF